MRYTAFNNLGQIWGDWAKENAPSGKRPWKRKVADFLGVSHQTVAQISSKRCTLDRVYDYMNTLIENGWPDTRIVVDGADVRLEVIGKIDSTA